MKNDDILNMPIAELEKRIARAREHLSAIDDLLPGLVGLTPDARKHSAGKYRAGEPEALASVLDAVQKRPALFESLASLDGGRDPKKFEVDVLRDRLARAAMLTSLSGECEQLTEGLDDTVLHLGDLSRPVMLSAYDIAKSHAKTDGAVAQTAKLALDFYAKIGRASAATRQKKAQKPTA